MTTIPSLCFISSRPSAPISSPGKILNRARTIGACASAAARNNGRPDRQRAPEHQRSQPMRDAMRRWPLLAGGSLALLDSFIAINRRQPTWPHAVMGLGALLWLAGNFLWLLGRPIYQAVPGWLSFLVL